MRILESKEKLRFTISDVPVNAPEGVAVFTTAEFEWMKLQNLSSEQFRFIWQSKIEDTKFSPMPLEKDKHVDQYKKPEPTPPKSLQKEDSVRYAESIVQMLRGKLSKDEFLPTEGITEIHK